MCDTPLLLDYVILRLVWYLVQVRTCKFSDAFVRSRPIQDTELIVHAWCVLCFAEQTCVKDRAYFEKNLSVEYRAGDDACIETIDDGQNVFSLDAVGSNDRCYLQCKLGFYHETVGDNNKFACAPETDNRTKKDGKSTEPSKCEGG